MAIGCGLDARVLFFFKQKTAYEMRISDWSSDVCSSDLTSGDTPEVALDDAERRHAAGLMRINHVGEVCAQALYVGQAAVARDPATRGHLLEAAQEETDHLAWCADRLRELDSRPSLLNPVWYAGSYAIGQMAGLRGAGWNLG